jgi:predicted metal-dependent enzyme (double-stranded beta helix superfamily)/TusA-related sulfurtransferase
LDARDLEFLYAQLGQIVASEKDSQRAVARTRPVLAEILTGRLIDPKFLRPIPTRPAAYLVHRPPDRAYSIVSMVWDGGQRFPIHDHLSWGLIGVYRNRIREERYTRTDDGAKPGYAELTATGESDFEAGQILEEGLLFDAQRRADIHRILNPTEGPAVSIHILASDLGMKHRNQYDPVARTVKKFVSGYDDPDGRLEGRLVAGQITGDLVNAIPQATLDTRGLVCPFPTLQTEARLHQLHGGELLEVLTDSEDSAYDEIPTKLKAKGVDFAVLELPAGGWKVRVRR